jgi:tight adherence protein B
MTLPLLAFFSAALAVGGVYLSLRDLQSHRDFGRLKKRLSRNVSGSHTDNGPRGVIEYSGFAGRITKLIRRSQIGISYNLFVVICLSAGAFMSIAGSIFYRSILASPFFFVIGCSCPYFFLRFRRSVHEQEVMERFPEMVSLMARHLRSGQSLNRALHEAGMSLKGTLGFEILRMQEETSMGIPFDQALAVFRERLPAVSSIRLFCASLTIHRKAGGNLAETLDNLSRILREQREFKKKVRTLSAEGRISSAIIGALPIIFALIIFSVNPEYIRLLFTHPLGKKILLCAIIFEIAGFAAMRALTEIAV